jgi:hypothetical protein
MAKLKVFRYSHFDLDALLLLAGTLRKQACSCDNSKPPLAGSLNWVIFVSFEDGVEWVFRSPHSGQRAFLSGEYTCRLLSSEVATLKYLKAHSAIPVPEVFAYRYATHSPRRVHNLTVAGPIAPPVKMTSVCLTS